MKILTIKYIRHIILKQNIIFLFCLLAASITSFAQVSSYSFTQAVSSSPFSGLTSKVCHPAGQPFDLLQTDLYAHSDGIDQLNYLYADCQGSKAATVSSPGFPIGFNFIYDGEVFDRFAAAASGYIRLGKTGQTITLNNELAEGGVFANGNNDLRSNVISVHQKNVDALTTPNVWNAGISYITSGLPGQRKLTINWGYNTSFASPYQSAAFAIVLYEGSNKIQLVYRPRNGGNTVKIAVGLRGKEENNSISNLNIRKVTSGTNTWATSIAGTNYTDLCDYSAASSPTDLLTYTWTPPALPPAAPNCPSVYLLNKAQDTTGLPGYIPTYISNIYSYKMIDNATNVMRNPVLYWPGIPGIPTQYDVYLGTDNPILTLVSSNQTDTSYTVPAPFLVANTTYYYKIVPHNVYGSAQACTGKFTTGSTLEYCRSLGGGSYYVKEISFNTISYTLTGALNLTVKFPENAPYITNLQRSLAYNFYLKTNVSTSSYPFGGGDCYVYFDWNQDGDFNDSGETIYLGGLAPNQSLNYSVTIPNAAVLGKTLMRVRVKDFGDFSTMSPCLQTTTTQDFIVTITPAPGCETFSLNPAIAPVKCFGESSGSIELNPSGGQTPYSFSWTGSASIDEDRNDLSRATYQAFAIDANGCKVTTPLIAILQPAALAIDTNTATDGSTDLIVNGGTAPYSFLWSNGNTFSDPDLMNPGMYNLTITDQNGCSITMNDILVKHVSTALTVADKNAGITVYPNPTSGNIYLQNKNNLTLKTELLNAQGVLITSSEQLQIDLSYYPEGVYLLRIYYNSSVSMVKIIKK